jgi:CBS domain-containing protein
MPSFGSTSRLRRKRGQVATVFRSVKSNKYRFMKVKEIMTKHVEAVVPDIPIQEAAGRMRSLDVRVLPVSKKIALSEC